MQKNIGLQDRIFRFMIALALFGYAIWQQSLLAAFLGLFTLYEALASWCIFYYFIGKSSCPIKKE